jgi:hypothetical protein
LRAATAAAGARDQWISSSPEKQLAPPLSLIN